MVFANRYRTRDLDAYFYGCQVDEEDKEDEEQQKLIPKSGFDQTTIRELVFTEDMGAQTGREACLTAVNMPPNSLNSKLPLSIRKAKEEVTIAQEAFVQWWQTHILPKRFKRVQH